NEPFLCFSTGCGYRARLETWYKDKKITPHKIMEFGTLETILRSVSMGLGISFVPQSSVTDLVESGLIHCHRLPEQYSKVKTVFIRRKDSYLTASIERFIETIENNKQVAQI